MKKTLSLALTANALLGCGNATPGSEPVGTATEPVWNGVPDTGPDQRLRDRVGRLTVTRLPPPGSPPGTPQVTRACTGTFVTQDLFLTASHCVLAVNLPGTALGGVVSGFVNSGWNDAAPVFTRQLVNFNARLNSGNVVDSTDNLANDIAIVRLETAEAALARLPNGPDGTPGGGDDPVGPDGVLGTPDDVDAYLTLPTKPYASNPLPATGSLTGFIEEVGYGRVTNGLPSGGMRNRNTFGTFVYDRSVDAPSLGPDLDGDGTIDPFLTHRLRTSWLSSEPPMGDGIPGSADDIIPVFTGLDNGDSGGPLLLWNATKNAYEQIGIASTSCTPSDVTDADAVANNGNESPTCSPVQCPVGQFWNGAVCAAIPPPPPGAPAIATQTGRWNTTWADLTTRSATLGPCASTANCPAEAICTAGRCVIAGNQEWLASVAQDSSRPNRWLGERDYATLCRASADTNCDRFFEDQGTENCPNFFDAEAGFVPELRNNPPAIYGSEAVILHDRVVVRASPNPRNPAPGGIAAGKGPIVVRNDVRLGKIWGGDHLEVHWRSQWTTATLNDAATYNFVGTYPASSIPVGGALVPSLRYTARPADPAAGAGFPRFDLSVTPPLPLPTTLPPLQNCNGMTPDTVLNPGAYISKLTINGTCRVALRSGKYYFDSLIVEPDARLKIDHSNGAVEIFVRNELNFKGDILNAGGRSTAHVISYFGTKTVHLQSNTGFLGTLVAPNATIDLNSKTHQGAFYGNKVAVQADARVLFSPCTGSLDGTAGN